MANSQRSSVLLLKEGFLMKRGRERGEIIKKWVRRYCVLNPQCLCYFKKQTHDEDAEPMGRVFLDDIINIEIEASIKKKPFCFCLHTDNGNKRKSIYFNASSEAERLEWIDCIKNAKEKERKAEREDPFRKTLKKLTKGLKRIKLEKDPDKGIGCTIKNAAGVIIVNRIIEDGPIAATGVLKPGDEILEIHGITVTNKSVDEIAQIIRECPDEFLATVRPLVSVRKPNDPQTLVVTSDDHTDHDHKHSYQSIEAVDTSNNHTDHDHKHSYQSIEAVDTSNNHTDHDLALECVQDNESAPPLSPSPPPIPPHTKESYILLESVNSLNSHTGHDYKHSYKSIGAVDTSNNHADHDYKPTSNGTDKLKRRPHVYEEIDTKFNPVVKTNGMPSGEKKMSRSTPDVLTYADLDFRQ